MSKIAIQGVKGSFHHEAAIRLLGENIDIHPCSTFQEVFEYVVSQEGSGLVAVENNIYGSINEVYRLLQRYDTWIAKDVRLRITQNLIASHHTTLQEIGNGDGYRILSQAPAFAQVERWLDAHLPQAIREETHDTADSVRTIVQSNNKKLLAIAGNYAAQTHEGYIVAESIQDSSENYTRFILIQHKREITHIATHASIILKTDHTPGALLRALTIFEKYQYNLTKLDSHPITGDQQHYAFYIDFSIDQKIDQFFTELSNNDYEIKELGRYTSQL